jgi:type IX secretion system PorP/SprF family membrane protein
MSNFCLQRIKRIRTILVIVFLSTFVIVRAQDSTDISLGYPVYSQYLQNGLIINPAYAGTRGSLSTFFSYRLQWADMPGAPKLQTFSLHSPLKNDKVGLGIQVQFMQYGVTTSQSLYATYAYHIKLRTGKLSLGLKGGFDRSSSNYSEIITTTPKDPVFSSNAKPYMLPNIGAGAYYFSENLFAGISIPAFLSYKRNTGTSDVEGYHSFGKYDFIFSGGGLASISKNVKFKPSVLIDYSLDPAKKLNQLDLNANFILSDIIWLGMSWRTTEEVLVGIAQIQVNQQIMVGFSYDYSIGRMNTYSKGSYEFILRYEFGSKVSAANPRYF